MKRKLSIAAFVTLTALALAASTATAAPGSGWSDDFFGSGWDFGIGFDGFDSDPWFSGSDDASNDTDTGDNDTGDDSDSGDNSSDETGQDDGWDWSWDDGLFRNTPFFGDDWFDEPDDDASDGDDDEANNDSDDRDLGEIPGCQEGEVHIPEDRDCDGEIDDDFLPDNESDNESDDDSGGVPGDGSDGNVTDGNETDGDGDAPGDNVTEARHVTPAPEPSAVGEDWISYPNPRDHYKHPEVHREGSIKVCKILLNQNNEVVTGSTVPDTTFSLETDIPYGDAQPVTWTTELNQVADVVGTSPDYREGDGYLDAECAEFHDLPLDATYHYGQETLSGEHADEVELVGYQEYWERDLPPYKNAEPYGASDLSDGEVTLTPGDDNRHAEIYVVNRLTG